MCVEGGGELFLPVYHEKMADCMHGQGLCKIYDELGTTHIILYFTSIRHMESKKGLAHQEEADVIISSCSPCRF